MTPTDPPDDATSSADAVRADGGGVAEDEGADDGVATPACRLTAEAQRVLEEVAADRDGEVAVVLNDGCCDGMGPVAVDEPMVGYNDVRVGTDRGVDVYTPPGRAEMRSDYEVVVDVDEATGGEGSFSLELPYGYRLTAREEKPDDE